VPTQPHSGAGLLASCVPTVAMLPGAVAGVLAFVGLGASSAAVTTLAPTLNDVAQPLLLVSAVLLAVSGLRCNPIAVASAAAGGVLLYLGMYQLTRADGTTSATLFTPGSGASSAPTLWPGAAGAASAAARS